MRRRSRATGTATACLLVLGLAAVSCGADTDQTPAGDGSGATATTETFVSLSDLHFDPFYDPSLFGRLMATEAPGWLRIFESSSVTALAPSGADSNYNLLASAVRAAAEAAPAAGFAVISGDFLSHGFQTAFGQALAGLEGEPAAGDCRSGDRPPLECFTDRTIEFVALLLREAFDDAPIYPVLGNNDSYCGDYEIDPVGPFVRNTAATWGRVLIDGANVGAFEATFVDGGHYAATPPGTDTRLLALNTNIFSSKYRDACAIADAGREPADGAAPTEVPAALAAPGAPEVRRPVGAHVPDAAETQLAWLERQLESARQADQGAWLLYHIPVGIDVYATLHRSGTGSTDEPVSLWRTEYSQRFADLVTSYGDTIRGVLAGHTHMDQFILVPGAGEPASFQHVTPAVTPLFGNNPGFEVFTFDPAAGGWLDYTTHYLPAAGAAAGETPSWTLEYRFRDTYGRPGVAVVDMAALWPRLEGPGDPRTAYQRFFPVSSGSGQPYDEATWAAYWCGIGAALPEDFTACRSR